MTSDSRRVARNFSALVLASIFSKGLLFIWQIVLGNLFAPYEYGVYNTVTSLMAVSTSLVAFGMGLIMIREVARNPQRIGAYWSAMLTFQTIFATLAYVIVIVTAIQSGYDSLIIAYTAIGALSLIVDMFGNVSYDLLIAQERMTITATVEVVHIVLRITLAGAALSLGYGLLGIYLVTIATGVFRSGLLWGINWCMGNRPQFPIDRPLAFSLLRDGAPLALSGFLSLAYQHADKLMTTAIIGAQFTGYLGPAFIINYGMIELISTTIIVAVYPLLSRYYAENELLFSVIVEKLARFMLLVALPMALVFSIFARPIILLIYNPQYAPTADLLAILIWSTLLMMVGNVFNKALLIQNRQRISLLILTISLSVNIALNAFFLHTFRDPRGTAIATVVAQSITLTLSAYMFRARGFAWGHVLPGMARILLLGAVTALVMIVVGQVVWFAGVLAGLATYTLGVLFAHVLGADDWAFLYRFVGALPLGVGIQRVWGQIATIPKGVLDSL